MGAETVKRAEKGKEEKRREEKRESVSDLMAASDRAGARRDEEEAPAPEMPTRALRHSRTARI